MKTKYDTPIQRDILIAYAITFLTIIGGTVWWAWIHLEINPNSKQPTTSQVQILANRNLQPKTSPSVLSPVNPVKVNNVPLAKGTTSANTQVVETVKSTISINTQTEKIQPKTNSIINRIEPQVYWLQLDGQNIRLAPQKITVEEGISPKSALIKAFNHLLNATQNVNLSTTIPAGTKLLSLEVNDSKINVNLSKEFAEGGGSTSMIYRVAQIIYTASSINPNAKIYLLVEGKLLDENYPLGGEGLVLREPITRQQLVEDFSIS
ncbi:GerMN domain-containing protein [Brunnivagina elsteri]|uniref:GerMN domain-containing protein n=1 Tax=Brunnivagina elsteri CCALA 953 TaxID=987040 RepID=A0A2A2TL49_9CYAN|nr:GerMN domain-containing protein [Calothrix elsteri]PAX58321.1 hypothetical protein CK510_08010 [Calothrix elsteri CCALA 953]